MRASPTSASLNRRFTNTVPIGRPPTAPKPAKNSNPPSSAATATSSKPSATPPNSTSSSVAGHAIYLGHSGGSNASPRACAHIWSVRRQRPERRRFGTCQRFIEGHHSRRHGQNHQHADRHRQPDHHEF